MTTFNTKNQAKRKYYYSLGLLIISLLIIIIVYKGFDVLNNEKDTNTATNLSLNDNSSAKTENNANNYVTISTNFGELKGLLLEVNKVKINSFLGVPYASPPVGPFRFKNTPKLNKWNQTREATQQPSACLQTDSPLVLSAFRFLNSSMSEDCLYLNIWAPHSDEQLWPVIVYIHGGVFSYGGVATEELDGAYLAAQENVIVVSLQYRLGIFGFINFETSEASGNMGLYDQQQALKWIHENINHFGGDNDQITVVGHGAGAISVGLHMIQPDSKSYFQRVILQGSGLMLRNELFQNTLNESLVFAKHINCFEKHASNIIECIKNKSIDELLEAQSEILEENPVAFRPTIPHEFVSTFPSESIEAIEFQTDFIFGLNSEDDSLFVALLKNIEEIGRISTTLNEEDSDNNNGLITANNPSNNFSINSEEKEEIATEDEGEKEDEEEEEETDGNDEKRKKRENQEINTEFICPFISMANSIAETDRPVYIYRLNDFTSYHDEVVFAFGYPLKHHNLYDKEEIQFSKYIMKNWSQFARNSEFTESNEKNQTQEEWRLYSKLNPYYMEMSISNIHLKTFNLNCDQLDYSAQ